jgi:hypothetical protein
MYIGLDGVRTNTFPSGIAGVFRGTDSSKGTFMGYEGFTVESGWTGRSETGRSHRRVAVSCRL